MFNDPTSGGAGDTRDLMTVVRLTPMPAATRAGTLRAIRDLRHALSGGPDVPVALVEAAVEAPSPALRAALGPRHSQVLSDSRRALRAWRDGSRRAMALRHREGIPSMEDAIVAAQATFGADKAKRATSAIERLAASQSTHPAALAATSVVVEPLLVTAQPETFGVETRKSLDNLRGLIRAAVALVDPDALRGRCADVATLPETWRGTLALLEARTSARAEGVRAILRRLAVTAARQGLGPREITDELVATFFDRERATRASTSHREKLAAAGRLWNAAVAEGALDAATLTLATPTRRLPSVPWSTVPSGIREPFDKLAAGIQSPTGGLDWASFVTAPAGDDLDAELGLVGLGRTTDDAAGLLRGPGTLRNWRDAVKRVWHAAEHDPRVVVKPRVLEDLFAPACVLAAVRATRGARRDRIEAQGKAWKAHEKGRYETSLVQALVAVGRALGLDDGALAPIVEITYQIDPSVVGTKIKPDGTLKRVYEERRIGQRHADMLRQFGDTPALRRWFGAPSVLWRSAEEPLRQGRQPTLRHAALARSALIAQIEQRVCPLRRTNLARLRAFGDERHISLPVGDGEGWLSLPAAEMKNLRAVKVRIDPDTVRMIRRFIEVFRPVVVAAVGAAPENPHLFVGAETERKERGPDGAYGPGLGYTGKDKLNSCFSAHMRRHAMLRLDLHVMRHLAAKVILDQDPSAMSLVQEILAHKSIETTRAYYAEVCGLVAQARYLELLDQATRKALTRVSFTVDLNDQLTR